MRSLVMAYQKMAKKPLTMFKESLNERFIWIDIESSILKNLTLKAMTVFAVVFFGCITFNRIDIGRIYCDLNRIWTASRGCHAL